MARRRAGWGFRAHPGTKHVRINLGRRPGSVLPRVSSVSLKAGWFTYNTRTGRTSVNTPGIGSAWFDTRDPATRPARPAANAPAAPVTPELRAYAKAHVTCPTCQTEPGDVCRTGDDRHPTRMHAARLVAARNVMTYGTDGAAISTAAPRPVSTPAPAGGGVAASLWATVRRMLLVALSVTLLVVGASRGWLAGVTW